MGARKTFDIRHAHGPVLAFRTVDEGELTGERGPGRVVPALVFMPNNDAESYLSGPEVEALHQFTYEILAGPARDPRLDVVAAQITCGFRWAAGDEAAECCLGDEHPDVSESIDHVSSAGLPHWIEPPF